MLNPVPDELLSLQDEVRQAFGWLIDADASSASEMHLDFMNEEPYGHSSWNLASRTAALHNLKQSISNAEQLIVVGAGSEPISVKDYPGARFVAADGAVGALDDLSSVLCVVSDGDGAEHLERAARAGVHIILHAHGDNLGTWKELVRRWSQFEQPPPLTLTHQSKSSLQGMFNPGGFTDGDRALCFIQALGRSLENVGCIGFRTDVVGAWSGTTNPERKKKKLEWMEESMHRLGLEHHLIRE